MAVGTVSPGSRCSQKGAERPHKGRDSRRPAQLGESLTPHRATSAASLGARNWVPAEPHGAGVPEEPCWAAGPSLWAAPRAASGWRLLGHWGRARSSMSMTLKSNFLPLKEKHLGMIFLLENKMFRLKSSNWSFRKSGKSPSGKPSELASSGPVCVCLQASLCSSRLLRTWGLYTSLRLGFFALYYDGNISLLLKYYLSYITFLFLRLLLNLFAFLMFP